MKETIRLVSVPSITVNSKPLRWLSHALIVFALTQAASAQETTKASPTPASVGEVEVAGKSPAAIFQLYMSRPWKILFSHAQGPNTCEGLGNALKAAHGVTFVNPIIEAPTEDLLPMKTYFPHCSNLKPHSQLFPEAWQRGAIQHEYLRTKESALYKTDLSNKGQEDYILYSQGMCERNKPQDCMGSLFFTVNSASCTLSLTELGEDSYKDGNKYGLSAIVSYNQLNWVLTLQDHGHRAAYVSANAPALTGKKSICSFDINPNK